MELSLPWSPNPISPLISCCVSMVTELRARSARSCSACCMSLLILARACNTQKCSQSNRSTSTYSQKPVKCHFTNKSTAPLLSFESILAVWQWCETSSGVKPAVVPKIRNIDNMKAWFRLSSAVGMQCLILQSLLQMHHPCTSYEIILLQGMSENPKSPDLVKVNDSVTQGVTGERWLSIVVGRGGQGAGGGGHLCIVKLVVLQWIALCCTPAPLLLAFQCWCVLPHPGLWKNQDFQSVMKQSHQRKGKLYTDKVISLINCYPKEKLIKL